MASPFSLLPTPRWRSQYRALVRKQFLLASRSTVATGAQLFLGVAVCLLLLGFQALAGALLTGQDPHPDPVPVGPIPRCALGKLSVRPLLPYPSAGNASGPSNPPPWTLPTERGCTTLMFAPVSPLTTALMQQVATDAGLVFGADVLPLPGATASPWQGGELLSTWVNATLFADGGDAATCTAPYQGGCGNPELWLSGDCLPCAVALDNRSLATWHAYRPNSTQNSVWVFGAYADEPSYAVYYNLSLLSYPWFTNAHTAEVKAALDRGILGVLAANKAGGRGRSGEGEAGGLAAPTAAAATTATHSSPSSSAVAAAAASAASPLVSVGVTLKPYPKPAPRIAGFDVFSSSGGQWLFTVPAVLFFFLLTELAYEKEMKLRVGMSQMGLHTSAYWASWLTYAAVMCVASSLVLQAAGYACGFPFYKNSNFAATFLLFLSLAWSMACLALLVSTLISSSRTAQTVGYSFLLVGFLFQSIIDAGYAGMLDLLYSDAAYPWVRTLRNVLAVYPPFDFAYAFYAITAKAGIEIDLNLQSVSAGPGFFWSDMTVPQTRLFFGYTCNLPAPIHFYLVLWADAVGFLALALYLDAVLPGPQGQPAHPLFFLGYRYHTRLDEGGGGGGGGRAGPVDGLADPGVVDERAAASKSTAGASSSSSSFSSNAAAGAESAMQPIVRVHRLRVVYRKGWGAFFFSLTGREWSSLWGGEGGEGSSSSSSSSSVARPTSSANSGAGDVVAVDDLSLTVRPNEILALLGHNGAGKTTTISVLTGLGAASAGLAEIAGVDVSEDPHAAQGFMGVCPQHDILWPQLTARETLRLFASIKGLDVPGALGAEGSEREIDRVLAAVSLQAQSVQNRAVGGFSGGMKRRLSVAIAALGAPRVLFLDEPTTGMDPVTRRGVWGLIHRLKKHAAIVLTTHRCVCCYVCGLGEGEKDAWRCAARPGVSRRRRGAPRTPPSSSLPDDPPPILPLSHSPCPPLAAWRRPTRWATARPSWRAGSSRRSETRSRSSGATGTACASPSPCATARTTRSPP
jgi:ABC-type multidrug transport system ATPase subunit